MECFVCDGYAYRRDSKKDKLVLFDTEVVVCDECTVDSEGMNKMYQRVKGIDREAGMSFMLFFLQTERKKQLNRHFQDLKQYIDHKFDDMMPRGAGRE